jgi:uroporphyrinogen-III synthase
MRVLVTRPRAQAGTWVDALRRTGVDAIALPLIEIGAAPDPAAVAAAWSDLASRRLVVFVSPSAAEAFFDAAPPGAAWPDGTRAAAPGPGTSAVLAARGVPALQIVEPAADAAQFDSASLWTRLEGDDWRGASILLVRGPSGREWLAERFRERSAKVDALAAYTRSAPPSAPALVALRDAALALPLQHLWLFSSAEAIDNLVASIATDGRHAWRASRALATHPRIAERARAAGFGRVAESRPALSAVVACIQSMRP